jgi:thiamine biosynthesis lipoprotein
MRPALGTFVEIQLSGPFTQKQLERKIANAFGRVAKVDALMSFHSPSSDLSRLNRAVPGRWIAVHPWTAHVLRKALAFQKESDGVFDVAIADPLVRRGVLPGKPTRAVTRKITRAAAAAGCACFEIAGSRARRLDSRRIDLGGIAKGFAVDQAVKSLHRSSEACGLVNAGGDLRAFGAKVVKVHIRTASNKTRVLRERPITLRSAALATSEARHDKVLAKTQKIFRASRTVSLAAPDCMTADALTKIALMADPAVLQRCLLKHSAALV